MWYMYSFARVKRETWIFFKIIKKLQLTDAFKNNLKEDSTNSEHSWMKCGHKKMNVCNFCMSSVQQHIVHTCHIHSCFEGSNTFMTHIDTRTNLTTVFQFSTTRVIPKHAPFSPLPVLFSHHRTHKKILSRWQPKFSRFHSMTGTFVQSRCPCLLISRQ